MALILRNGVSQSPDRWLKEPRNNQDLFATLRKYEYNPDLMRLYVVGGGGCLIRKHYDYHRRDIAADEVDYLNVEDPDVFSHRAWELEYQRKQEMRRNQPVRSKKKSHDMEL